MIRFLSLVLIASLPHLAQAADEAEHQVWQFHSTADAWGGNGPLAHAQWPVRDKALRVPAPEKGNPYIEKNELRLPADKANVVQIEVDARSARKCRIWFATGISLTMNTQKIVEFDLRPDTKLYTLDLKSLETWKDQIANLRFEFLGAKPAEELAVYHIKVFEGDKTSTPMVYTTWRPGQKRIVSEFRLGCLFNNRMILQQHQPLPIWGRARPGEQVSVEFASQKKSTTTDATGKWQVVLEPLPASAEPRTITVTGSVPGHRIELSDVLVGDVWLCGGQSNMGGSPYDNAPPAERRKELLETDYPNYRFVRMPSLHRETWLPNDATEDSFAWSSIQARQLASVSAVSYYFGQAVHASQKIPVGLIFTIKAGSQVEQWLDRQSLASIYSDEELKKICAGTHLASGLHNGMIAPISPMPIRGAIWYQGESNANNEAMYMGYYRSLPALVRSWRNLWGKDLPVLLVQLPAFNGGYPPESWAFIREVQLFASQHLPHVGMAVTFDEGDAKNLHPANKYFVGTRLGLIARAQVYGEKIESSGPVIAAIEPKGEQLELRFEHVAGGLKARGALTGFEIRGADLKWQPARAEIVGNDCVMVSSANVKEPAAVRYAWSNAPVATLFNDIGLPASPFRSDTPVELRNTVKASGDSALRK